jgi:4-hydroxy-4-methyl-2-oxoglutarate aldolase
VLTTGARARGLAGLVIDGGVRDVAALEAHGFPVFARVISLPGATKTTGGEVGGEVTVGDVVVADGDWIVADVDGVVVIAKAELDAALTSGQARAEGERAYFAALRGGVTTVDLLGLDADRVTRQ